MKVIQAVLGGILFVVVLYFFLGELVLQGENPSESGACNVLEAEWERVYPDGTRQKEEIPGTWKAKRGEIVRAETVLPENQKVIWGCMRSSQQDIRIYVDNELRKEYSTKDTRLSGKTSASAYVFFELYAEDAGKVLAIETVSDSGYSGRMNEVMVGEKQDIWNYYIGRYGTILLVALTMLILSIVTVFVSLLLRVFYKKDIEITYLGLGIMLASLVLISESLIRQFFLPNITVASNMGYFATMLMPYPFLVYVNRIQKQRYQKMYTAVELCVCLNFLVSVILHVTGLVDLLDRMVFDYGIIILSCVLGAGTLIADLYRKKIKEYWEVAVGLLGMAVVAVWEVHLIYRPRSWSGGFGLCVGLCFLLAMAALKTGRDIQRIEQEKQRAIVTGEAKAQFLAHMSHEIRTPINTIIGMNEMILRESKGGEVWEYAKNIESSSRLLLGLINDVLDFSKIEAGKLDITNVRYSLKQMLDNVVQELKFKAESKGLNVQIDIEPSLPERVIGDEIRVRQILTNLVSNAIKYTKKGTITFTVQGNCTEAGFSLLFSVADTGIGIRKEDMDRLFGSFQRMEERKNRHIEGTGLGLAITKQLIELMNGSISVQSEYGKGSCFLVSLPQEVAEEVSREENKREAKNEPQKETKTQLYAPEAVVIAVDDNSMNLQVVQMLLRRTGIQVEAASGGEECLELCRRKKYDLVLMDHMMPDMDGIETLHALRKEEESPNRETKVVVLTANAIAGAKEEYRKEGFADYLSKPLVADELEAMLAKHLPKEKVFFN